MENNEHCVSPDVTQQQSRQAPVEASWWWTIVNILFLIELLPLALLFLLPFLLFQRVPKLQKPFLLFIRYYAKVIRETVRAIRSLTAPNPVRNP